MRWEHVSPFWPNRMGAGLHAVAWLVTVCALAPTLALAETPRPFWTEQSSFLEGEWLYGVGVATRAPSPERGRQQAYEHAKSELSNYAQLADLSGLSIETQMTFEEHNRDDTWTVYRLLKVSVEELLKLRTARIEQKKHDVELLEQQTAEMATLDARAAAIHQKMDDINGKVHRYVRCGMASEDVYKLLGRWGVRDDTFQTTLRKLYVNYGHYWLTFQDGILVAIGLNEKVNHEGQGCSALGGSLLQRLFGY